MLLSIGRLGNWLSHSRQKCPYFSLTIKLKPKMTIESRPVYRHRHGISGWQQSLHFMPVWNPARIPGEIINDFIAVSMKYMGTILVVSATSLRVDGVVRIAADMITLINYGYSIVAIVRQLSRYNAT
jgi:hypothetical protein